MSQIDWIEVNGWGSDPIGAVGFIGNEAVMIVSYYDDADGNEDGKVSAGEWIVSKLSPIRLDGRQVATVAKAAGYDLKILQRDSSVGQWGNKLFLNYFRQAVNDGFYAAYFRMPVSKGAGMLAGAVVRGKVKQFVVKKSTEAIVKKVIQNEMAN